MTRACAWSTTMLAIVVAGCASAPAPLDAPRSQFGVEIAPYARVSECMLLAKDERVTYRFSASSPVDFSVWFREDNAVIVPVDVKANQEQSGDFTAQGDFAYCLTWEAGANGAVLEYRVQPVRPRR
jgi:hypothetical protein